MIQSSILKFIGACILGIAVGVIIVGLLLLPINKSQIKQVEIDDTPYELELVREDLQTYGYSTHVSNIIIDEIEKTSKIYKLPIGLMHAIFRVESDYKFNITHPTVTVPVHGKTITTNAIGLGGILWCYWGDSLKVKGIAENEIDLYLPDINVRASGYILRYLIDDEMNKKTLSVNNILDNVVTRYYGAYSSLYLAKMERITSDLWMKRIAKELIKTFKKDVKNEKLQ